MTMNPDTVPLSLKARVTLFTLAIFLVCLWTLTFYGRTVLRETVSESLSEQQYLTASFLAAGVNQELQDRVAALEAIASSMSTATLHSPAAIRAALDGRPVLVRMFEGRTFAARLDAAVTPSAALQRLVSARAVAIEHCVARAIHTMAPAVCVPPSATVSYKTRMVTLVVPVRDHSKQLIGVVGGISSVGQTGILDRLARHRFGSRQFLLIAPQSRQLLLASDAVHMMQPLPRPSVNPALDRILTGSAYAGMLMHWHGAEVIATARPVPLAGWQVLVMTPTDTAFAPFVAARERVVLAAFLLSVLAGSLTWLMLRRELAPLLSVARALAAYTDTSKPLLLPVPAGDDEIGSLIASFERLLEQLRQRQQALADSEDRFRCLTEMSADFYWETDPEHRLTQRSLSPREVGELVFSETSAIGCRRWELPSVYPDQTGWDLHRIVLNEHLPFRQFEVGRCRANGAVHHLSISGDPVFDASGKFLGYRGIGSDITDRKIAELALIASERRLGIVLDGVQSAVMTIDENGIVQSMNKFAETLFGYSTDEVFGNNISMLMPEPYRAEHDGYLANYQRTGIRKVIGRRREVRARRKDGSVFPIELGVDETELNGKKIFIGTINDISFRKQAEAELRIAATAMESQHEMFVTDADNVILRVNRAFTEVTGYSAEEAVGQTPRLLKSGRHGREFYHQMWTSIAETGGWQGEIWGRRKNGEIYPKWLTITAVKDDHGVVTHYVGAHFDITERKRKEEQVRQLAFYDPLTELPNRRLLDDRLQQAMAASARNGKFAALMFLDLDNFKALNDTHGHAVGDLLLIEAAARLSRCVRRVDTVARFGGDEFVVMLSELNAERHASAEQAYMVAEKIRASLASQYVLRVMRDGETEAIVKHICTVSVGVTLFLGLEACAGDIMKWADSAMYRAKESGKNLIRFHKGVALDDQQGCLPFNGEGAAIQVSDTLQ